MTLSFILKTLRHISELTQEVMAEKLGISQAWYNALEKNRNCSYAMLTRISNYWKIAVPLLMIKGTDTRELKQLQLQCLLDRIREILERRIWKPPTQDTK